MTFTVAVAGASATRAGRCCGSSSAIPRSPSAPSPRPPVPGPRSERTTPTFVPSPAGDPPGDDGRPRRTRTSLVLALPHGASGAWPPHWTVRWSSTAGRTFRLIEAADWEAFYGSPHGGPGRYGLPELLHAGESGRARSGRSSPRRERWPSPGCNSRPSPSRSSRVGLVDARDVVATLAVGYSARARLPSLTSRRPRRWVSAAPYAVGGTHRHIPEIEQNLRSAGASEPRIAFQPVLVPMSRGILASVTDTPDGGSRGGPRSLGGALRGRTVTSTSSPRGSGRPPRWSPGPTGRSSRWAWTPMRVG
jgi:N-acetyl-gamma-glutamyl-phosphate reductase